MWGAIIGDISGSIYEFLQLKKVTKIQVDDLLPTNGFYSDDTILTIAIIDTILNNGEYEKYLKEYILNNLNYKPCFEPYFNTTFSPRLIKWANGNIEGNSRGNGALMRIAPIGYLFNNEEDVLKHTLLATIPSHNTDEAIVNAQIVSLIIFYARKGFTKNEIVDKLKLDFSYKPFVKFNVTCSETLPNCLYALFESNSFEEAIKKVISFGGDTDTNACIVGAMAESLYGIDNILINRVKEYIPQDFSKKLELAYNKVNKK